MMGGPHSQHRLLDSSATAVLRLSESFGLPLSTVIFVPNKAHLPQLDQLD